MMDSTASLTRYDADKLSPTRLRADLIPSGNNQYSLNKNQFTSSNGHLNSLSASKPIEEKKTQELAPKKFTLNDFDQLGVIGRGSFGQVRLVRHLLTGQLYALKTIQKEKIRGAKHI